MVIISLSFGLFSFNMGCMKLHVRGKLDFTAKFTIAAYFLDLFIRFCEQAMWMIARDH
jgi:hypothetical protein